MGLEKGVLMRWGRGLLCIVMTVSGLASGWGARASDHDDGEIDLKGRSLNLTDVYAFREDKEIAGGSNQVLVFLINSNPRSLPRQQYFFSTTALYDLHISRAGTSTAAAATTADNVILRMQFAAPDSNNQQAITVTSIVDGTSTVRGADDSGTVLKTTSLAGAASPVVSNVTISGQTMNVFAGLRKDPFFFDVSAFFKFRAAAAASSPAVPSGFASFPTYTPDGDTSADFTRNFNVNTIGYRVPIAFLQKAAETVFDIWATISVPQ
jgi:hypothetical protein